jgi:hypothetical protein
MGGMFMGGIKRTTTTKSGVDAGYDILQASERLVRSSQRHNSRQTLVLIIETMECMVRER